VDDFVSTNIQYTPITDVPVNGWGNGEAMYDANNVVISNGLSLTITNSGCPDGLFPPKRHEKGQVGSAGCEGE
jgi:hypothetical protein